MGVKRNRITRWLQDAADALQRGRRFVTHDIWHIGGPGEQVSPGLIIKHIRVAILLVKGVLKDDLLLRASALTFATMLAIVPFLALMFYMIQAFNVEGSVADLLSIVLGSTVKGPSTRQFLLDLFRPAQETAENPTAMIISLAERGANPGTLTLAGLIFVLTTVFGMMMNIESSLNTIWGIHRRRSYYRAFGNYIKIIVLLPFLVVAVMTVQAILNSPDFAFRLGRLEYFLHWSQYAISWVVFTVFYYMVPNTRIKFRYALLAGVIAGTVWSLLSLAYIKFQYGLPRYSLMYSTLAQVPVLLMWVYMSWLTLLAGAELSFAYQNESTYAMERLVENASYAYREAVGVWAMAELCRRFDAGEPGLTIEQAAMSWNVPSRLLNDTLRLLEDAHLVVRSASEPPLYQPARSLDKITAGDVVACLREAGRDPSTLRQDPAYEQIALRAFGGTAPSAEVTMADLARSSAGRPDPVSFDTGRSAHTGA